MSRELKDQCCGRCRFWLPSEKKHEDHLGVCRRYPPVPDQRFGIGGRFPETGADEWCGEFQPVGKRA